jgi:G3E family GTPase
MLRNIPVHVIAGPLGAGKTSLIRQLMAQRPAHERWAVLINEFGQVGLDAALLTTAEDGIALGEVAGGCLCCVNGAPFQVGLGRLLRQARPQRVFIEPSGLGHPAQLLRQLRQAPWQGVLAVQPSVLVLDAQALSNGQPLPDAQREALADAGLLVMNKAELVEASQRLWITSHLPDVRQFWTDHGYLPLADLPVGALASQATSLWAITPSAAVDNFPGPTEGYSINPQADSWSIGWQFAADLQFDREAVEKWVRSLDWRRAKMVIHSSEGWQSLNALDNAVPRWKPSEWRKDSRIELIFTEPQDPQALDQGLRAALNS